MNLLELKDELYNVLKVVLPSYADVIFRDDNGDVLSWAASDIDGAPDTIEEALEQRGIAIAVCNFYESRNLDETSGSFVRVASYPIIVTGNNQTAGAPVLCNVVSEIESTLARISKRGINGTWRIGSTKSSVSHNFCYILMAEHNYTK